MRGTEAKRWMLNDRASPLYFMEDIEGLCLFRMIDRIFFCATHISLVSLKKSFPQWVGHVDIGTNGRAYAVRDGRRIRETHDSDVG